MKLGLALSGGGVKGLAHAGVLQALEENGIKIDAIGGTSAGSMVAVMYAMGIPPYYIKLLAKRHAKQILQASNLNVISEIGGFLLSRKTKAKGFKSGRNIENLMINIGKTKGVDKVSDLKMPILITAVDLVSNKKCVFPSKKLKETDPHTEYINDISMAKAVRASCSLPVLFDPCYYKDHIFVDGGILDSTPAREVKKLGVEKVLSIRFASDEVNRNSNVMDILFKTMDVIGGEMGKENLKCSDMVITIPTKKAKIFEADKVDFCYEQGYKAIMKNIDKIKNL